MAVFSEDPFAGDKQRVDLQLLLEWQHQRPHNSHPTVQSLVPYLYLQNSNHLGRSNRRKGKCWHPRDKMCINHLLHNVSSFAHLIHWPLRRIFSSWSTQMSKTSTGSDHGRWGITCIMFDCLTTSTRKDTKTTGNLHYVHRFMFKLYIAIAVWILNILSELLGFQSWGNQIIGKAGSETSTRNVTSSIFYAHQQKTTAMWVWAVSLLQRLAEMYFLELFTGSAPC